MTSKEFCIQEKTGSVQLQQKEREQTGIKSLKIGYNRIFGYYIDITKPNLHLVPPHYQRRQTTATGERYTLPELQEKETLITHADERVLALERELYAGLVEVLRCHDPRSSGNSPWHSCP